MKPMIKYRGGKSREFPSFEKYIPRNYNCYYEPFLGGGAVYFYLEQSKAVINDINADVAGFYMDVQKKYDEMRVQLDELQRVCEKNQADYKELKSKTPELRVENRNEELYYRMRDMFNSKISKEYLDSVIYYFINKTAYSGMIRYNSLGEYNVPFGRYANFNTNIGYHIIIKSKNTNHTWDIYCRDGDGYRSLVISHKHKEDIHFMNRLRCIQRL